MSAAALVERSGAEFLEDPAMLDQIAEGMHDAGNPYFDFIFDGAEVARATLRRWITRKTSEVFAGRAHLLFDGGELVGGWVGMLGSECRACRMADTAALFAQFSGPARAALLARLESARHLFATFEDDDWYASKLWVRRGLRGKGYARILSEGVFTPGPGSNGVVVGDVRWNNEFGLRAYAHFGLVPVKENVSSSGLRYVIVRREPKT